MVRIAPACLDGRLKEVFLEEAARAIRGMRDGVGPARGSDEGRSQLRRSAHLLRGNAAMLGFEVLSRLAGAVEELARRPAADVAGVTPALLSALAVLEQLVAAVANGLRGPEARALELALALRPPQTVVAA
jgi:chemotaxis protein histidine kinase CheA